MISEMFTCFIALSAVYNVEPKNRSERIRTGLGGAFVCITQRLRVQLWYRESEN